MIEPSRVAGLCVVIALVVSCFVGVTAPAAQDASYEDIDSQQNLNKQSQSRQRGNQKASQNRSAQSRSGSKSGGGERR